MNCCSTNICKTFLCDYLHVSPNFQPDWILLCKPCKHMASLHCVFVGVFSDLRVDWKTCCIQYNWRAFLCCVLKCAFSLNLTKCMNNHNSEAWLLLIWYFKLSISLNDLLQLLQMNLFSLSVCFKICTFRFPAETLEWLQKLHLYSLSPVWMRLWIF